MDTNNDVDASDATRLSRSWIDVFAECGTVLGRVLSFLDEIDVLYLERTNERVTPDVTGPQWAYLEKLDQSRTSNKRWRQTTAATTETAAAATSSSSSSSAAAAAAAPSAPVRPDHNRSRLRGIHFANNFLYAKNRALEAYLYFDFDRQNVTPEQIPVRGTICLEVTRDGRLRRQRQPYMPACWRKWVHLVPLEGNRVSVIDVFLDLTFRRENPTEILSWRGFRKAHYQKYQGISLKLDLESLVEEMGWKELLDFRDKSRDYAFTHFDMEESQQQMRSLMQKIQITLHLCADQENWEQQPQQQVPTDQDPLLLIATGGVAFPAWARRGSHMVIARNANIGRFHCRHGEQPLAERLQHTSRAAFLRIPTSNSMDQTLGIMLKLYD